MIPLYKKTELNTTSHVISALKEPGAPKTDIDSSEHSKKLKTLGKQPTAPPDSKAECSLAQIQACITSPIRRFNQTITSLIGFKTHSHSIPPLALAQIRLRLHKTQKCRNQYTSRRHLRKNVLRESSRHLFLSKHTNLFVNPLSNPDGRAPQEPTPRQTQQHCHVSQINSNTTRNVNHTGKQACCSCLYHNPVPAILKVSKTEQAPATRRRDGVAFTWNDTNNLRGSESVRDERLRPHGHVLLHSVPLI